MSRAPNPLNRGGESAAAQAEAEKEMRSAEQDRLFAASVLKRDIPWAGHQQNGFITQKDLGMLLDYDKQSKQDQAQLLSEKGVEYAGLFVKCLEAIYQKDTTEYLVLLIDQMLAEDPLRGSYFASLSSTSVDPSAPFLRIITSTELNFNAYTVLRASIVLGQILSFSADPVSPAITKFLRYVLGRLANTSCTSREHIASLLAVKPLLKAEPTQVLFRDLNGMGALSSLLNKDSSNAQLVYSIGFNVWLLTFNGALIATLSETLILKRLVAVLKVHTMEKVIRVVFLALRNIVQKGDVQVHEELIGHGLPAVIETLGKRKYKDTDIAPDIEIVGEVLADTIKELSSFDLYSSEVISGNLQWTPAHKNEVFWRENIARFEDKNYKLVARLIELLADDDETVREIACFDLGEFARFSPEGKKVVNKLGGKPKLMLNLQHKNPKVAKAALLATQKLMVANWEYLSKSSSAGVAGLVQKAAAAK